MIRKDGDLNNFCTEKSKLPIKSVDYRWTQLNYKLKIFKKLLLF